jgi:putative addiction module killer protein
MIDVQEYVDSEGRSPFGRWFNRLPARGAAKVRAAIARFELGNLGDIKPVGDGVSEHRIHGGGYRILLAQDGETLVILLGGSDKNTKKGQSTDIKRAKKCWDDYRRRKKAKE